MFFLVLYRQLCLSLSADNSQHDLLVEWLRLSQWMYAGAMSSVVDRERYRECVVSTLRKYFSDSKLVRSESTIKI